MMETGLAVNHFSMGLAYVQQAETVQQNVKETLCPKTCSSKMRILTVNFLLHSLGVGTHVLSMAFQVNTELAPSV